MSQSGAKRFMAVAESYSGKSPMLGGLPATALYALAAHSTPDEARKEVEQLVVHCVAMASW